MRAHDPVDAAGIMAQKTKQHLTSAHSKVGQSAMDELRISGRKLLIVIVPPKIRSVVTASKSRHSMPV